jgi:hypothetical protein
MGRGRTEVGRRAGDVQGDGGIVVTQHSFGGYLSAVSVSLPVDSIENGSLSCFGFFSVQ